MRSIVIPAFALLVASSAYAIIDCKASLDEVVPDGEIILVGRIHKVETVSVPCETEEEPTVLHRRCGQITVLTIGAQDYLRGGGPKRPRIHLAEHSVFDLPCDDDFPLQVNMRVVVIFESVAEEYWSLDSDHTVYLAETALPRIKELLSPGD